jgi:GNAT superfamily N-acetyltransferase
MSVVIKEVVSRKDITDFVRFPARLHRNNSRWVPPLYSEERRLFDPKKNPAFTYSDSVIALAVESGDVVGRIGGIINRRYNTRSGENTARFGFIECANNNGAVEALFRFVEEWAIQKGMEKVVGPMGFTDQNPEGLLVEGFEHEPAIGSYMNREYLPHLIENNGYAKDIDYVVYSVPVTNSVPTLYERIYRRIAGNVAIKLLEFDSRRSLKPYIKPVLQLMNDTFQGLYGFVPLDQEEMNELARAYLPVIDPRFVKVVTVGSEVVAFILGIPNMNDGFRKARGRLFPVGFIQIRLAARKTKRLDLLLGAIKPEYRGRGLDVLLGRAILLSAKRAGITIIDSHHETEGNWRIRKEMEKAGGQVYKRYRIYKKKL